MNKVLKGLVAVVSTAAMAIAGFAGAASATAAGTNYDITVPSTDTHTYSVYQVFTGDLSEGTLSNIKAGQNFNKNNTANKSAADAAAEIAQGTYADNTAKLAAITPYVDLAGTAYGEVSAKTALSAPAGYYLLKDKDAVTGNAVHRPGQRPGDREP